MKKTISVFALTFLFCSSNSGQTLKNTIEETSYRFLKASITKDSLSFINHVDMDLLTININKQKLDSIKIGKKDLFFVFVFRFSTHKITRENREALNKNLTKSIFHFSDFKKVGKNLYYIKIKWSLFSNKADLLGLFFRKKGESVLIENVNFLPAINEENKQQPLF